MLNPSVNRRRLAPRAKLLTVLCAFCLLLPFVALRSSGAKPVQEIHWNCLRSKRCSCPHATVIMTNHKTSHSRDDHVRRPGEFQLRGLPAGEYEMKAVKPGI